MTTHQIQALLYPGPSGSRCRERLKFLTDAGFIGRIELPSLLSDGRRPYVYVPKKAGLQRLDPELQPEKLTAGYQFLSHILDISEVYVRLSAAAKIYGYTVHEWLNDLTLKRRNMVDTFEATTSRGATYMASLVPDASFVIATKERPFRFLLEVDKGTETLKDIEEKFIKYRFYFDERNGPSVYERRYGSDRGRVLFVVPSLQRLENVKEICEKLDGKTRYWFATLPDLTGDALHTPIWRRAGSKDPFNLI